MSDNNIDSPKLLNIGVIKHIAYYVLAGLIPLILVSIIFSRPGVNQGFYSVLTSDLQGQYINYMYYFRDALYKGEPISYTFSGLLGTDTMGLIGYYLLSPLNVLLLFCKPTDIPKMVFTIIKIKIILAGITSALYFDKKRGVKFINLMFAIAYAGSAYIFAYYMHLMWLEGVYMLPLIALGIDQIFDKRKTILYTISLAYLILVNYYSGYMVAGFSLLYFIYRLLGVKRTANESLKITGTYMLRNLIAGLISAVVLIPTGLSQIGVRGDGIESEKVNYTVAQILSKLFTATFSPEEFATGGPQIYCGSLMLLFVLLYFYCLISKKQIRLAVMSLFLIGSVGISFFFEKLDLVWHIFSPPHSFTFRYAFVFVFIMLLFAEEFLHNYWNKVTIWALLVTNSIIMILASYIIANPTEAIKVQWMVVDIVILLIVSFCLMLNSSSSKIPKKTLLSVIFAIQLACLGINSSSYVSIFRFDDHSTEGYYNALKPVVSDVERRDTGLYRIEKTFYNSTNDSFLLSYNGLSFFSSSDKGFIRAFMANLGYNRNYFWVYYDSGATLAGDSLLGVKYILSADPHPEYEEIMRYGDIYVYENTSAMEVGTVGAPAIRDLELEFETPFVNQQAIYSALLGHQVQFFEDYDYEMTWSDDIRHSDDDLSGEMYARETLFTEGAIYIRLTARDNKPIYMFISSNYEPTVDISVNGEDRGQYITTYHQGIFSVGSFEPGEEVLIQLNLVKHHAGFTDPQIVSFDEEAFRDAASELKDQSWQVVRCNNTYIKAVISPTNDGVLFTTIPYQKGWEVYVDGNRVNTYEVCDALLAFDVTSGNHTIEMKFKVLGLIPGAILTAVGFASLGLTIYLEFKRKPEEIH